MLDETGSGRLKILMLYANPPVIRRGEKVLLCYGVANATSVRFEPPVDGIPGPCFSRCLETHPAETSLVHLIQRRMPRNPSKRVRYPSG